MKKMIFAILLCIATIGNESLCMKNKTLCIFVANAKDPVQVKQNFEACLAIETSGQFSNGLLMMENALISIFDNHPRKVLQKVWDEETLTLATFIATRPAQRDQLLKIIKKDNPHKLETLIKLNPCMLNAYNSEQKTILHKAVQLQKIHCVKKLVLLKANPNCVDGDGCSPLHRAVEHEAPLSIIEDLLTAGAKPGTCNHAGKTPFTIACEMNSPYVEAFEKYGYLIFLSLWPYKNPFELLKNNGHYLKELANQPIGSREWEIAETALEKLFDHIDDNDLLFDHIDKSSINSLHKAFIHPNGLILHNADKEQCEQLFGKNVLDNAKSLIADRAIIKKFLISAAKNNNDLEKLQKILQEHNISAALQHEILKTCIESNNIQGLVICLNNGFNPNRYHKGISLLHHAVRYNNPQAITLLAEYNADLVPLNNQEQTPLDCAVYQKRQECINAMAEAINNRLFNLYNAKDHRCGLVKHFLMGNRETALFCEECVSALVWQKKWHGL